VLYHSGDELVTDWPAIFTRHGFRIVACREIIGRDVAHLETRPGGYEGRGGEVTRRYGQGFIDRVSARLERIPRILNAHGTFPVLSAQKPS
jgi:hypothetical protein